MISVVCSGQLAHTTPPMGRATPIRSSCISLRASLAWSLFPGLPAVPCDNNSAGILVHTCTIYSRSVRSTGHLLLRNPATLGIFCPQTRRCARTDREMMFIDYPWVCVSKTNNLPLSTKGSSTEAATPNHHATHLSVHIRR